MIRVLIADDHTLVRKGIRALLERTDDIRVVGEAEDGARALKLAERLKPDVLLLDIAMPRLDGAQVVRQMRAHKLKTPIVILSMFSDHALVRQTLRDGARGYLLKQSLAEELLLAVRAAARRQTFVSPALAEALVTDALQFSDAESACALSTREREVLQLVVEGGHNPQIANLLGVSVKTVEKHRASIMRKLGVHDTAALVRYALTHGLVFGGE